MKFNDDKSKINMDEKEDVSQAISRYSSIFTQQVILQVPVNTALCAGDIIKCDFPQVSTEDEMDELFVAGWLHDFGKVATPDHIMNKSTKLEGLYDKIVSIEIRSKCCESSCEIWPKSNKASSLEIDLICIVNIINFVISKR